MPTDARALNPDAPAHYCICAQGPLDDRWLEMLSGVWVIQDNDERDPQVTTLVGSVAEQAALLGVLNHLCDLGIPLLSVEWLFQAPDPHVMPPSTALSPAALGSGRLDAAQDKLSTRD